MGQPWGCTPGVRSEIGDRLPCAAKALAFALNQSMLVLVGEAEAGNAESNPPRNSRPETHPFDERGRGRERPRPHRRDRFPHASENSLRKLPRSGLLW